MSPGGARVLVLIVRLHGGRYHGEPEWPPAPARLFQALIAGCARASRLDERDTAALEWLESLPAPRIVAPPVCSGQMVKHWVPNNDLDSKRGDPEAVISIRTGKNVRPRIFDASIPIIYAWPLGEAREDQHAMRVARIALELYQLGRGTDMASASGMIMAESELEGLLEAHAGVAHRPTRGGPPRGRTLACPTRGSLASLEVRHRAMLDRFRVEGSGRRAVVVFRQPPKPHFEQVAYDSLPRQALFELRHGAGMGPFCVTPLDRIGPLVEVLRDGAAQRLSSALPAGAADVERGLVGRRVEGVTALSPGMRMRIVPLPSIGHRHVDRGVRRVLVEVPVECPLRADDVFWAFSGLSVVLPGGAEALATRTEDVGMLEHYAIGSGRRFRRWRTLSPAALPAIRRRIEPTHRAAAKASAERSEEECAARGAVQDALRHAGIHAAVAWIHVQREPFTAKGARAEAFAVGMRFAKEALWHVEIVFRCSLAGPIVLGDGRFLGLGVMEPVRDSCPALVYRVTSGLEVGAVPLVIAVAARRAVLARFQERIGATGNMPAFVSGHDANGGPTQDQPRVAYVFDPDRERILLVPPRGGHPAHDRHMSTLSEAVDGFSELLAGSAGRLTLEADDLDPDEDPLFAPSRRWTSVTPYVVNRHSRATDARTAVARDLEKSCRDAGLPAVSIRVRDAWGAPDVGLSGTADLEFRVAVRGPLLMGRTRYKGGGLFAHAVSS